MRHLLLAATLVSLVACGSSEPSAPAAAPERAQPERAAVEPAPHAPSPAPPTTALPVRPPPLAESTLRSQRAELAAARALVSRGELPEAVRAFDALIERTGGSPRILCEAGYVAHRAGDQARARTLLDRGIDRFRTMDETRADIARSLAMCLYNSGLVYEATAEPGEAAIEYDWSLELRPNDTVRRRYEALPAEARQDLESERPARERSGPGDAGTWEIVADLQAAVEMTERIWCRANSDMDDDCGADAGELIAGEGRSFQLVHVGGSCCDGMSSTSTTQLFVIEGGRFRHVAEIVSVMDMGGFDSVGHELRDVRALQLIPGGPSELSFEVSEGVDDREDAYCESRTTRHGFCVDHRGALTCRIYTVEDTQACWESWQDFDEGEEQLAELSHDRRGSVRFLEDGRVQIEGEMCVPAGQYTVDDLFERDCGRP